MRSVSPIVEAISGLRFEGNIVPHSWYASAVLRHANGKPNLVAIILLSDVIYWYRQVVVRDENTGAIIETRTKFAGDKLHKNFATWGAQFGFTERQVRDAVTFLRHAGLVTVEYRVHNIAGTLTFIEPVPDMVREISACNPASRWNVRPSTLQREAEYVTTSCPQRSNGKPKPPERETYMDKENTREISSENPTKTTTCAPSQHTPSATAVVVLPRVLSDTNSELRAVEDVLAGVVTEPLLEDVRTPKESAGAAGVMRVTCDRKERTGTNALVGVGVSLSMARRLTREHGDRRCSDWVEALPYCRFDDAARYIVSALQNGWNLPPAMLSARKDNKHKEEQEAEKERGAQARRQIDECARQRQEAQAAAWEALPENARQQITAAASAAIASEPMGQRILSGPIGKLTLRARCLQIADGIRNKASPPQTSGSAEDGAKGELRDSERLPCQDVSNY